MLVRPILVFFNSSGNVLLQPFSDVVFIPLPFIDGYLHLTLLRTLRLFLKYPISPDVGVFECQVDPPLGSVFIGAALFESAFDLGPIHSYFYYFDDRSLLGLRILLKKCLLLTNSFLLLVVFIEAQQHN